MARVTYTGKLIIFVLPRYLKYLTKKYLKKNNLRDWLRVVASSKECKSTYYDPFLRSLDPLPVSSVVPFVYEAATAGGAQTFCLPWAELESLACESTYTSAGEESRLERLPRPALLAPHIPFGGQKPAGTNSIYKPFLKHALPSSWIYLRIRHVICILVRIFILIDSVLKGLNPSIKKV